MEGRKEAGAMPDSTRRIAIVGAGCSGTLLAAQLLR